MRFESLQTTLRLFAATAMVVSLAAPEGLGIIKSPLGKRGKAKYVQGTIEDERGLTEGSKLVVVVDKNRILLLRKDSEVLSIPVKTVTAIGY